MLKRLIGICFVFLFIGSSVFAQNEVKKRKRIFLNSHDNIVEFTSKKDTVYTATDTLIISKDILVTERDSAISINKVYYTLNRQAVSQKKDTIIRVRVKSVVHADTIPKRNERVLKKVRTYYNKDNLLGKAMKSIFIFDDNRIKTKSLQKEKIATEVANTEPYNDKIVRNINVTVFDPAGSAFLENDKKILRFIGKTANILHINTHQFIIINSLLFSKGKKINSYKVAESERLLRQTGYIYDAKIIVETDLSGDSVDVLVIVQDVWSISASGGLNPSNMVKDLDLKDANLLGLGHQFETGLKLDPSLPGGYNYIAVYNMNNIYNTFCSGQFYYRYEQGIERYGGGVNRDFISPLIKYGGGVNLNWTEPTFRGLSTAVQDYWAGYAYNIHPHDWKGGERFISAIRLVKTTYTSTALVDTLIPNYANNNLYLLSVGYQRKQYYRDSYIYHLGRTEDIPTGALAVATLGRENSIVSQRNYFGFTAAWGEFNRFGYMYGAMGLGGFQREKNWEEAVLSSRVLYFSPLFYYDRWKWRGFVGARYAKGFDQKPGVLTDISGSDGLRGLSSPVLSGNEKFVVNYEADFFPPLNLLSFKAALLAFVDMGWISSAGQLINSKNLYSGYGIGFRFQNEHLTFAMIQVMFVYYPNAANASQHAFELLQSSGFFYNYNNFDYSRPTLVAFN